MMGLSNWLHWSAWFIKCFVFLLIPMVLCSIMLCVSFTSDGHKMLNHSNGYLIFVYLMLYAISGVMFCFFVSTLFYRANIAAAGAGVLWFLAYIPYFFLFNYWYTISVKTKVLACLDFQVAMSAGAYLIGQFEGQGQGVQWSNLFEGKLKQKIISLFYYDSKYARSLIINIFVFFYKPFQTFYYHKTIQRK